MQLKSISQLLMLILVGLLFGCTPDSFFEGSRVKVKGIVVDGYTGEPIPGVRVLFDFDNPKTGSFVINGSKPESKTVFSDYRGHFIGYFDFLSDFNNGIVEAGNQNSKPEVKGAYVSNQISFSSKDAFKYLPEICTLEVFLATKIQIKISPTAWPQEVDSVTFSPPYPGEGSVSSYQKHYTLLKGDTNFFDVHLFSIKNARIKAHLNASNGFNDKIIDLPIETDWRKADKKVIIERF